MRIAVLYTLLAALATVANIGSQEVLIRFYNGPYHLSASVLFGTAVGLVVKYVLDKRCIFRFKARDVGHDSRTFVLYTIMGLVTTAIFWGFEFGFHWLYETREMRYLGGVIGLAIGYVTKYHLDKRYVFKAGA